MFGHAIEPFSQEPLAGSHALCANPANLAGGAGDLHRTNAGPIYAGLSGALRTFLRWSPVEQFMVASIFLVAAAFLLSVVPGFAGLSQWASLLSILFFVLAIALSVAGRRGGGPHGAKRWRDRDVGYGSHYGPATPSLWESLRTWWRRRRFRRL